LDKEFLDFKPIEKTLVILLERYNFFFYY